MTKSVPDGIGFFTRTVNDFSTLAPGAIETAFQVSLLVVELNEPSYAVRSDNCSTSVKSSSKTKLLAVMLPLFWADIVKVINSPVCATMVVASTLRLTLKAFLANWMLIEPVLVTTTCAVSVADPALEVVTVAELVQVVDPMAKLLAEAAVANRRTILLVPEAIVPKLNEVVLVFEPLSKIAKFKAKLFGKESDNTTFWELVLPDAVTLIWNST